MAQREGPVIFIKSVLRFYDSAALIALALVYYDLRVRKEVFDIEYMMASMEKAEAAKA